MYIAGLYFVFVLLQSLIVGYYSDNNNSTLAHKDNMNIDLLYNFFNIHTNPPLRVAKRSFSKKHYPTTSSVFFTKKPGSHRATKKQYELIDILWKNNKEASKNFEFTTNYGRIKNINKDVFQNKSSRHHLTFSMPLTLRAATTSKFEFYYLDDTPLFENGKPKKIVWQNVEAIGTTDEPLLIFHLRAHYNSKLSATNLNKSNTQLQKQRKGIAAVQLNKSQDCVEAINQNTVTPIFDLVEQYTKLQMKPKSHRQFPNEYFFDYNASFKGKTKSSRALKENSLNITSLVPITSCVKNDSTTAYDKIKFFEIYDQFTPAAYEVKENSSKILNHNNSNLLDKNQKTLLEHLDNGQGSHDHIQAKHSKKHIKDFFHKSNQPSNIASNPKFLVKARKKLTNGTTYFMNRTTKSVHNNRTSLTYMIESARWTDYPFTAAYIYEPSQVHCDAAAINPYWLIASASCLSRVKKPQESFEAYGGGQSPFVTYCGDRWWDPERVAYVKYTVVHPSYHHKDKLRQHLYNIGAIQVVNSLKSACSAWAPVPLMSHMVSAKPGGYMASAIGWGLDRFDTRYASSDLPKVPLKVYKSDVYFDTCPGNNGYSKTKELDGGSGVKNVLCLALPPYYGEKTDPVHGGLLLADGKLIALYLQEERRAWGEQSAQYTGVWRLIPWIMDIAREPEEMDTLIFDV